jgi:flagellar biosynthesis protein FlhF
VGAVEQLSMHAELAAVPVEAVYQASDLEPAMRRLARCQIILADCPGRGPRLQRDADTVRDLLRQLQPDEVHLVLPPALQPDIARRLIEHHRARGATHLLASKVDEVPDDWTLFDLAAELRLPMRWVADGQRVPQDLRSAAPRLEAAEASARSRRNRRQESVA